MVETKTNVTNASPSKSLSYSPSFLVSFVVDARGGLMNGRRHAGVDVFIPQGKVCQPTRITCRLIRKEKLQNIPVINEEEAFASRVLEMGPVGTKFNGEVIIDIPHFASRVGRERELLVMRSDDGKNWIEHDNVSNISSDVAKLLKDLDDSKLEADRCQTLRIITKDFPKYFVVITRMKQQSIVVNTSGGNLNSDAFLISVPKGAVTKETKIGFQMMSISKMDLQKSLGRQILTSPIVTIEPRRRRFHQPIRVGIAVSNEMKTKLKNKQDNDIRLIYSLTAGNNKAQWEDITHSALISLSQNNAVFDTTVSARYWLLENASSSDAVRDAGLIYKEVLKVPFIGKFYVLVKRHNEKEAQVRILLLTDTEIRETLEGQEKFEVAGSSDFVEVFTNSHYSANLVGNISPAATSPGHPSISFFPFRTNRLPIYVTVLDESKPAFGQLRISELVGPEASDQEMICSLDFTLPKGGDRASMRMPDEIMDAQLHGTFEAAKIKSASQDDLSKATELKLFDISQRLGGDWIALGKQLGITDGEIVKIQKEYGDPQEQAILLLHLWMEKKGDSARASQVEAALRNIHREDIVASCLHPQDHSAQPARTSQLKSIDEALSPISDMPSNLNGSLIDEGNIYEMEDIFDGSNWIKKRKCGNPVPIGDNVKLEEPSSLLEDGSVHKQVHITPKEIEGGDIRDKLSTIKSEETTEVLPDGTVVQKKVVYETNIASQ